MFSHLFPWKLHKFVLKSSEQDLFLIYVLSNPINMCWNHQNRACFSEMIDLRGHMLRFTWKMNIFPSISLEMPEMCVEILSRGLVFLRWSIWGVTCLGLLKELTFSHLSPEQPHKCMLKPSEQGLFFQDNQFEGSHAWVYSKNDIFPCISLETPEMCVETLSTGLVFLRQSIWGVTCLGFLEKLTFCHLSP